MAVHVNGEGVVADSSTQTGAAIDTVHAEMGPIPLGRGGHYQVSVILGADSEAIWDVEHRNAANTANVDTWRFRTGAGDTAQVWLWVALSQGERVRVVNKTSFGQPVEIGSGSNSTSDSSVTITVGPAGVPAGATIFVDSVHDGALDTAHSCADSALNSYVADVVPTESQSGVNARRFRASNNIALVQGNTITVSWTGLSVADGARAYYIDGIDLGSPLTGTPTGQEGTGTNLTSGDLTTADAPAIILGFVGRRGLLADGFTEDADFTTIGAPVDVGIANGTDNRLLHTAYRIVSATETQDYSTTIGLGRVWAAGISAYKAADVGSTWASSASMIAMRMK